MESQDYIPETARITEIRPLSTDTSLFRLDLSSPPVKDSFLFNPGQFFQLTLPAVGEAPFTPACAGLERGKVDFCIRRVGHVTRVLHGLEEGSLVGLRGPFGNGFPMEQFAGCNILLLAGGLGIAPIRSLLLALLENRGRFGSITLMYGARELGLMLFREELMSLSRHGQFRLMLTVDFAPQNGVGEVVCNVGLLPELLKGAGVDVRQACAVLCGPPGMYGCLISSLLDLGFPADCLFLSLERRMKCGVGRCCHCVVDKRFCCVDGPVFRYSEIMGGWDR